MPHTYETHNQISNNLISHGNQTSVNVISSNQKTSSNQSWCGVILHEIIMRYITNVLDTKLHLDIQPNVSEQQKPTKPHCAIMKTYKII